VGDIRHCTAPCAGKSAGNHTKMPAYTQQPSSQITTATQGTGGCSMQTCVGFCDVAPLSRYTKGCPFTSWSRIGKSPRTRSPSDSVPRSEAAAGLSGDTYEARSWGARANAACRRAAGPHACLPVVVGKGGGGPQNAKSDCRVMQLLTMTFAALTTCGIPRRRLLQRGCWTIACCIGCSSRPENSACASIVHPTPRMLGHVASRPPGRCAITLAAPLNASLADQITSGRAAPRHPTYPLHGMQN